MRVTTVAHTFIDWAKLREVTRGTVFGAQASFEYETKDADHLAEFAGRSCYKAYDRLRPDTAETRTYLKNILDQGHYSVLEHASVSFYVTGVSRSLLLELERHRFLSFSVESQRYVDQAVSHPEPVIPPALRGTDTEQTLRYVYYRALSIYQDTVDLLKDKGVPVKRAREAARAFLPNATPVDFVVTGNIRAWRDVLGKRLPLAADAEIREFAGLVLTELRWVAPGCFQDIVSPLDDLC